VQPADHPVALLDIGRGAGLALDDFFLVGTKIGFRKSARTVQYDFFIGIDNALNQRYSLGNDLNAVGGRYYNAAPARNYFVGIRIEFFR
jgi:iron complex outermembrane receptor protein